MSTTPTPPKAWIASLGEPSVEYRLTGPDLDPIERDALDSAVPFAAEHARRYIASAGTDDGWDGPRPILLLYTVGRKSGAVRRNPVLYLDHGGARFIVGSKGGEPSHPQWFANLVANPNVHIRVGSEFSAAVAEVLSGDERTAVWAALTGRYAMFAAYQRRTSRQIPLVRLLPVAEPLEEPVADPVTRGPSRRPGALPPRPA